MSAWVVVPSLLSLRAEFNAIAPGRDKGADGTIGDSSHTSTSDHSPDEDSRVLRDHDGDSKNEVHALDIDSTGPWPAGRSFASIVQDVIAGERAKWLDPNDLCRLNYVIFDRKIYDKDDDFVPRAYGGSDPHTNHAHFSARYETRAENDTRPWGVEEEDMPTSKEIVDELLAREIVMADGTKRTVRTLFAYSDAREQTTRATIIDKLTPSLALIGQRLGQVDGQLREGAFVNEQELSEKVAAIVLGVLSPAAIAAALPPEVAKQVADEIGNRFERGSQS